MPTDTNVEQLVINKLTKEQYNEANTAGQIDPNQLYLVPNEDTLAANVHYNNKGSKLKANDAQGAIDEVNTKVEANKTNIGKNTKAINDNKTAIGKKADVVNGKVPIAQLPVDDKLNETSVNPVQNKVVNEAVSRLELEKADLSYVNQTFANALVGKVSGPVVAVDDVSPVEHEVGCMVESTNRLTFPWAFDSRVINGVTFTVNEDGSITVDGTATDNCFFELAYARNMPELKTFKGFLFLSGMPKNMGSDDFALRFWTAGGSFDVLDTGEGAVLQPGLYFDDQDAEFDILVRPGITISNVTIKPMLNFGKTALPFTIPVPDLDKVTVSRYGGNLASSTEFNLAVAPSAAQDIPTRTHGTYSFSADVKINPDDAATKRLFSLQADYEDGSSTVKRIPQEATGDWVHYTATITTTPEKTIKRIVCSATDYGTESGRSGEVKNIMINIGAKAPFAPPVKSDYTPAPDGTVSGMTSLSPDMTILTDNPGVTVNAEYNRDINKAFAAMEAKHKADIEEIKAAILSTGGNV